MGEKESFYSGQMKDFTAAPEKPDFMTSSPSAPSPALTPSSPTRGSSARAYAGAMPAIVEGNASMSQVVAPVPRSFATLQPQPVMWAAPAVQAQPVMISSPAIQSQTVVAASPAVVQRQPQQVIMASPSLQPQQIMTSSPSMPLSYTQVISPPPQFPQPAEQQSGLARPIFLQAQLAASMQTMAALFQQPQVISQAQPMFQATSAVPVATASWVPPPSQQYTSVGLAPAQVSFADVARPTRMISYTPVPSQQTLTQVVRR